MIITFIFDYEVEIIVCFSYTRKVGYLLHGILPYISNRKKVILTANLFYCLKGELFGCNYCRSGGWGSLIMRNTVNPRYLQLQLTA